MVPALSLMMVLLWVGRFPSGSQLIDSVLQLAMQSSEPTLYLVLG